MGRLPASFNAMLMQERSSCVKVYRDNNCIFQPQATCSLSYRSLVIAPVLSGVRRLGTLLLVKYSTAQNEEDMILGEYSAAVIGMEIVYNQSDLVEEEIRKKAAVEHAFQCLSHSENEAVQYILNQLQDGEGVFVAARVANRIGYTQSVIVNALRKLESAGVLEARSLGVKGTYIRILNKYLSGKLQGVRKPVS